MGKSDLFSLRLINKKATLVFTEILTDIIRKSLLSPSLKITENPAVIEDGKVL